MTLKKSKTIDSGSHATQAVLTLILIVTLGGCQRYQPLAYDLGQHLEEWRRLELENAFDNQLTLALGQQPSAAPPSLSLSDGLSLTEAEWLMLYLNPELRVSRAEAGEALASAREAGWLDDPELELGIARFNNDEDDPWELESSFGLTIPLSNRLSVEKQEAWAAFSAAQQKTAVAEWEKLTQLRAVWIRWSNTRQRLEITEQYLKNLEELLLKAQRLAEVGELSATDARVFEIEQAERHAEFIHLQAQEDELKSEILQLTTTHPQRTITLVPEFPAPFMDNGQTSVTLVHPELLQLQAAYDAAEQQVLLEITKQRPDMRLGPTLGRETGNMKLGANMALTLPLWNKNRQAIAEKLAVRERAHVMLMAGLEQLTHQLAQAQRKLATGREHRRSLEEGLIPLTEHQLVETGKLLELGEVNVLLIQDAMGRSLQARLAALTARSEEALVQNELRRILAPAEWTTPPDRGEEK